jgi:hypothetical protein
MDNNQKIWKNLVLIGVVVIILATGGYLVWKEKNSHYVGYKTFEECQQKTGEPCMHDFGDAVLPSNPVELKKAKDCLSKVPSGWFPQSKAVNCTWPIN